MFYKKRLSMWLFVLWVFLCLSLPSFAIGDDKININTASVEELVKLNKVGKKYAQRIVEYRETNGPFKRPEDILKVKGIGSKIWESNKDRIIAEP